MGSAAGIVAAVGSVGSVVGLTAVISMRSGVGLDVGPEPAGGWEDDFVFFLKTAWPLVSSASVNVCGFTGAEGSSLAGDRAFLSTSWCWDGGRPCNSI